MFRKWSQSSFEVSLLNDPVNDGLLSAIASASPDRVERYGRLATHLFASTKNAGYLSIVQRCLTVSSGSFARRLREVVFSAREIKVSLLPGSSIQSTHVHSLVACLESGVDDTLASEYVHDLLQTIGTDKKGKKLNEASLLHDGAH